MTKSAAIRHRSYGSPLPVATRTAPLASLFVWGGSFPCKLRRGRATSRRDSYGTVCSCTCCNANIHGYVAIRMGLPTSVRIATWKHRLRRCSYGASRFHASCDGCFAIHMRQAAPLWIATREHLFASQSAGDGPFPTGCDADRGGRHCRVPRSRSHADDAVGDTHRGFAM